MDVGLTSVKATVSNPIKPDFREDLELIVDTGAILPGIVLLIIRIFYHPKKEREDY